MVDTTLLVGRPPSSGVTARGLPEETTVARLGLRVADIDRVMTFYREVIGLESIDRTSEGLVLGVNPRPLVVLESPPDLFPRPPDAAGLYHAAFRAPTREALAGVFHRLEAANALDGAADHGFSEALYATDPEDNGIEVYLDAPREQWPRDDRGRLGVRNDRLDPTRLRIADRSEPLPAGTDLGHVHLEVTDVDRSLQFYRDVLGFRLQMRPGPDAAFLAAGDYHHHIAVNTWGRRTGRLRGRGLSWIELDVGTASAVASVRTRLETHGWAIRSIPGGVASSDPDGITVRFVSTG